MSKCEPDEPSSTTGRKSGAPVVRPVSIAEPNPDPPRAQAWCGWLAGAVLPPLVVFGAIIVFGWGGGWGQLLGQTHPVHARVLRSEEIGTCQGGGRNATVLDKERLEVEWQVDGSTKTVLFDHCTSSRYDEGESITVWLTHDDKVAGDETPWFLRGMGLLFTVIVWAALLYKRHDDRKKSRALDAEQRAPKKPPTKTRGRKRR